MSALYRRVALCSVGAVDEHLVNLCLYCGSDKPMDPALVRELGGKCPKCGKDLQPRPAPPPAVRRLKSFDANPIEAAYTNAPVEQTNDPIVHDAHDVLKYAIALVDVVRSVERFTRPDRRRSAVLGFMTGSEGLDWMLRRRLGHLFEARIAHARGLSHKTGGHDPDAKLRAKLGQFLGRKVTRIAVIDEVVGGGQFRAAFKRIRDWHASVKAPPLALHLVAVADPRQVPESSDAARAWFFQKVLPDHDSLPKSLQVTFEVVGPVPLLAKDGEGQPLKDADQTPDGDYEVRRIWPGGYAIRCPNELTEGGVGLRVVATKASLDQLFGVLLYAVCGFGYVSDGRWPESIKNGGCRECKGLLAEARRKAEEVATAVPSPERVFGRVVGPPDIEILGPDGEPMMWRECE